MDTATTRIVAGVYRAFGELQETAAWLTTRMCFDGGSSFSGYGDKGFDRRVRVYQISQYGEKIETYKRLSLGDIIDQQILVGSGSIPGTGQGQTEF